MLNTEETDELESLAKVRALVRTGLARSIRFAAQMSLIDLARATGCAPSTIWRWENQQRVPHGDVAVRYFETLTRLMGGSPDESQ